MTRAHARVLPLREGKKATEHTLTNGQAKLLGDSRLVDISPAAGDNRWQVRARTNSPKVGAVRLGRGADAIELRIAPKIAVDRVMFLLGYASEHADWQAEPVQAAVRDDLLPIVADAFLRGAERALRPGVLFGYRQTEATLPMLRGRLRAADQLRRHPGLPLPLEVTYDEHTPDIPENQLLLGAARRLLRLPGLSAATRTGLRRLVAGLHGVTPPAPGVPPPAWTASRLNDRYGPALGLAELVLRGGSYELDDGRRVQVDGLLLDMAKIFETFLCRTLAEALRERTGGVTKLDHRKNPRHHLDTGKRHALWPDLVHYLPGDGPDLRPVLVVDAKYKDKTASDDLYQMLAYCLRLGVDTGHLVRVAGAPDTITIPLGTDEIRVRQHVLDLDAPPHRLRQFVAALADELSQTKT
ncbi:McrC family protein [Streptomyces millisiae]|uniref:Restriction endonuclease n=1 Tax=Streptomyces millisiae TaxID=3075542 RepID=A0ABU2LVD9_9ACTN|nr:restriction endonuclease [Streptomyces sp. DSM 44918]MDT0321548.1 restriction endonuclease [Streptomyces sp. DSM 44918]